jgi:tetratricopeptide (TPR) repeat protein
MCDRIQNIETLGKFRLIKLRILIRNSIQVLFAVFFFASCSSIRSIPVEVANVPGERISDEIQSLTLVNRAVNNRFRSHKADSLQQIFFQRQFNMDTVLLDTQAADTLLLALGDILFESGRFDVVIPENRLLSANTYSFIPSSMPWHEVDTLTKIFNTDAVLSLDHFKTRIITKYEKEALYDQNSNQFYTGYFANMAVAYESLFRIYNPAEKEVVKNIIVMDTLHWDDSDIVIRPLFNRFTTVKAAMIESGIHSAIRLSEKIAPVWRLTRRSYYFKGHPVLDNAHLAVLNGDWDEAADLWLQLAESTGSRSLKSKAEFNLALAYELFGDIDEAIRWGLKSYETMFRPVTYNYLETLNVRKQQLSKP